MAGLRANKANIKLRPPAAGSDGALWHLQHLNQLRRRKASVNPLALWASRVEALGSRYNSAISSTSFPKVLKSSSRATPYTKQRLLTTAIYWLVMRLPGMLRYVMHVSALMCVHMISIYSDPIRLTHAQRCCASTSTGYLLYLRFILFAQCSIKPKQLRKKYKNYEKFKQINIATVGEPWWIIATNVKCAFSRKWLGIQ